MTTSTYDLNASDALSLQEHFLGTWEKRFAFASHEFGSLGVSTGEDMITRIATATPRERDRLLAELVWLSKHKRHEAATSTLVQAFMPMIRSLVLRSTRLFSAVSDVAEGDSRRLRINVGISLFWEVLVTFPDSCQEKLPANLKMNLFKRLSREYGVGGSPKDASTRSMSLSPVVEGLEDSRSFEYWLRSEAPATSVSDLGSNAEIATTIMRVLDWAKSRNFMPAENLTLLGQYTVATSEERHALADALKISAPALSKKVHFITKQLQRHVSRCGVGLDQFA